jgi:Pentapeptide repeats (8 copies)
VKFEIKNWYTGGLIFRIETDNWRLAVEAAIKSGADLRYADLRYADLRYADLSYANLSYANLSYANLSYANLRSANLRSANLRSANLRSAKNLILPTGETWEQYLTETVPALLTAGGKSISSFKEHWECHEWNNCPMAHAFDVHELKDVPILLRPRAEQFIQFFDGGQIPWPLPKKGDAYFTEKSEG